MADSLTNTSNVHPSFSQTMRGSVDIGTTPAWQKTSGHIPGMTPSRPSHVAPIHISDTAKNLMHFPNALQAIYHE